MKMRKILSLLLLMTSALAVSAQDITYHILSEKDTTISCVIEGINIGSREIHRILYEYPSKDVEGNTVTISGAIWVPSNIYDGSAPCDGVVLYNHFTHTKATEQVSVYGEEICNGVLSSPLKPNYIFVISDFLGFGSTVDRPQAYLCGETNARNSLDGLLAGRQLMNDKDIPQGKYLFNMGYSQGGTETMFVAKLRDMEYKDKGITFDKTFAGGGPLDFEMAYTEMVEKGVSSYTVGLVLLLVSLNENYHLGLDYKQVFLEPVASHIDEWILSKKYDPFDLNSKIGTDSLKNIFQPDYLNINSEAAKSLCRKLNDITLVNGWEPDPTQHYFIEHSRHDTYVYIQSVRGIISWMEEKDFIPSIVPGKTGLQTNTVVFKVDHQISGFIWLIQTAAAIQFWPVLYYEGEQNRYYNDVVKDLNLLKVIKLLESWGIDLRHLLKGDDSGGSFFDLLQKLSENLAKVDLTLSDAFEMLADSGISYTDLMEAYEYLTSDAAEARVAAAEENTEAPFYLLRLYEKTLVSWLLTGGIDVKYDAWGW